MLTEESKKEDSWNEDGRMRKSTEDANWQSVTAAALSGSPQQGTFTLNLTAQMSVTQTLGWWYCSIVFPANEAEESACSPRTSKRHDGK